MVDSWEDEGGSAVPEVPVEEPKEEEPEVTPEPVVEPEEESEEPYTKSVVGDFYNAGESARDWPDLQDPETGATLRLEPGEEVKGLEVWKDFSCSYLKPLSKKDA